jgi:2-oxoglutarate ferredoxin oxidoreductase subunit alpha
MMQVKWGSHGDYEIIALCPNSPQECFDLTIKAFNYSEKYRVPVFVMMDEVVGHMTEKVVIPRAEEIYVEPRRWTSKDKSTFQLFAPCGEEQIPEMAKAGDGYKVHVTGLTHDERGYPNMTPDVQERMVKRLVTKIRDNAEKICLTEQTDIEGADVVVVSYGITSRVAQRAIETAREKGLKVGGLRLITAWPFPEHIIRAIAPKVKGLVVAELNLGQMVREVERCAAGQCRVLHVGHAGGTVHKPEVILKAIEEAAQ